MIIQNLGRKKKGVTKNKFSLFLTLDMCSISKKSDRTDHLFASPPPKSTTFWPLCIYAYLVIIGRLLMIIRNCRKEGRKEEEAEKGHI